MTKRRFTRRSFLRGLGGTAIALPFLNASIPGAARAATGSNASNGQFPKRFVVFFHPNGVEPDAWWPSNGSSATNFDLGESLAPLRDLKDKLLLMRGLSMNAVEAGPGGPHQNGMGGVLTGRPLQEGEMVGNDGSLAGWGDGISIDQAIADTIGQETPFKSLELGVRADSHGGSRVRTRLSYAGPGQPLPPQNDPRQVFDQLFSDFQTDDGAGDTIRQKRASVLDTVQDQFKRIQSKVSQADRERLDRHFAKIRDLERRLNQEGMNGDACKKPAQPEQRDPDNEDTMPEVMQAQLDLGIMAMACDLTRVVSIQVSNAVNHIRYPWLNSMGDGHALSHAGPSNDGAKQEWIDRDKWHAEQFAYLLRELDSIPEGDGTMLDNTCLLWVQEISQGNTHSHNEMPFVLAGNVDGQFRTGRYVEYGGTKEHNDLLAALGKAYGVDLPDDKFGDERFCSGPLSGITT
jgi:hypothetical protein